jgi:uncharacterized lipoprotein YbaY
MRFTPAAVLALCAASVLACHHTPPPSGPPVAAMPSGRLEGTVTYRQRMALPPGSVIHLTLADTAPGGRRWTQVITTSGENVPIHFSISYDAALLRPDSTYFAAASIQSGGRIAFASPAWMPALGPGAPASLELVLRVPDPLVGTWARPIPSQASRTEGIELTPQGQLVLVNICSMRGVSWSRSGDTLALATNTERYPDPLTLRTTMHEIDDTGLVVEKGGGYFVGRWSRQPLDRPLRDECAR